MNVALFISHREAHLSSVTNVVCVDSKSKSLEATHARMRAHTHAHIHTCALADFVHVLICSIHLCHTTEQWFPTVAFLKPSPAS